MIEAEVVSYLEMNETAVHELLLLLALYEQPEQARPNEILRHIQQQGYFRYPVSLLSYTLSQGMSESLYVHRAKQQFTITHSGKIRLRDLCELFNASPSNAKKYTAAAISRISQIRSTLNIPPFCRGLQYAKQSPKPPEGHRLYCILLHEKALQSWYRFKNSQRNLKLPCVYVGMTSLTPAERFDNHRFGDEDKRSQYVEQHGLCLMPILYTQLNTYPFTRQQALEKENQLAQALRQQGFAAFAGHHDLPSWASASKVDDLPKE